jgi:hypothetical protein
MKCSFLLFGSKNWIGSHSLSSGRLTDPSKSVNLKMIFLLLSTCYDLIQEQIRNLEHMFTKHDRELLIRLF